MDRATMETVYRQIDVLLLHFEDAGSKYALKVLKEQLQQHEEESFNEMATYYEVMQRNQEQG